MTIAPGNLATAQDVNTQLQARLVRDANLADVPNKPAARGNLGLGGMATQNPAAAAITGGTLNNVAIGGSAAGYGQFATLIVAPGGSFTAPPTGAFWSDDGATVLRMNDRLLVGGAVANDAAKPNVTKDWLSLLLNWPVFNATAAITSRVGTIALTVGSQTLDLDPIAANTTQITIGVAAFAIANNPGTWPDAYFDAYGFYSEAHVYPGTVSIAYAAEFEAMNLSGVPNAYPTPYRELQLGSAQALRLGSGGGQNLSPQPAISALAIVPNGSTFNVGIVFEKGALTGADGVTGFGEAIIMARGHLVSWYAAGVDGNGARTMFITSTISSPDFAVSIQAQDGGLLFLQPNNAVGFSVATVPNVANSVTVIPAATGAAAAIEAAGTGSNLNLALRARAGGRLEIGSTTQASAAAGTGGAMPANADLFMQVTVNGSSYVLPLLKAS